MFATWVGPVHPAWTAPWSASAALTARMVAVRTVLRVGEYLDAGLDPHHDQEWLEIGAHPDSGDLDPEAPQRRVPLPRCLSGSRQLSAFEEALIRAHRAGFAISVWQIGPGCWESERSIRELHPARGQPLTGGGSFKNCR